MWGKKKHSKYEHVEIVNRREREKRERSQCDDGPLTIPNSTSLRGNERSGWCSAYLRQMDVWNAQERRKRGSLVEWSLEVAPNQDNWT